jgi:integrase
MGLGAMIRLKRVQSFVNKRTGNVYHYFRRPGAKLVRLPGMPGSAEFMAAYQLAVSGEPLEIGAKRTKPGSISALIIAYYNSMAFVQLAHSTKRTYRGILERFRAEHGDKAVATLATQDVRRMINNRADKRGAAINFLKVLRAIMTMAVDLGYREDNPCDGVRIKQSRVGSVGHREWGESEISRLEEVHAIGTRARLALALLLNTGQRRSDVIRMGRQHERGDRLHVIQQKTGRELWIPILPELREIIDATTSDHLAYIVTQNGEPFTAAGFGNWFREMCDAAGLSGFSAHGLRKSTCRRLANAGCSSTEIMSISGHQTLKEVERYTRGFDQEISAAAAIRKITAGRK